MIKTVPTMIKRLLNYFNQESELTKLRREVKTLAALLNQFTAIYTQEIKDIKSGIEVRDARDQMLINAVVELQEKGVIYAN